MSARIKNIKDITKDGFYHLAGRCFNQELLQKAEGIFKVKSISEGAGIAYFEVVDEDIEGAWEQGVMQGHLESESAVIHKGVASIHELLKGGMYGLAGGAFSEDILAHNRNIFVFEGLDGNQLLMFRGIVDRVPQVCIQQRIADGSAVIFPVDIPAEKETPTYDEPRKPSKPKAKKKKRVKGAKQPKQTVNKAIIFFDSGEQYTVKRFDAVVLGSGRIHFTSTQHVGVSVEKRSDILVDYHDIAHIDVHGVNDQFTLFMDKDTDEVILVANGVRIRASELEFTV